MSNQLASRALRDLREQISREDDHDNLRELVTNINLLLNLIEEQVAKLEGGQPTKHH